MDTWSLRWRRPVARVALLACLAIRTAWGLDPARPLDRCAHRSWSAANSAFPDTVTALLESRDGFLWIGTDQGLMRFDGAAATPIPLPASGTPEVACLADTQDGSLWVGTSQPGLFRLRPGRIERLGTEAGLPDVPILHLLRDRDGTLWAAPERGPLLRLEGGRFRPVPSEAGASEIRGLAQDPGGSIWVGTADSGLWHLRDGRLSLAALAPGEITAVEAAADGRIWVGTRTAGLLTLAGGRLEPPPGLRELDGASVAALLADRQGSLWIGTGTGDLLRRAPDGRIERLAWGANPGQALRSLLEDSSGGLWVATGNAGLHLLTDTTFRALPSGTPLRMVCQDGEGSLWALTADHRLARVSGEGLDLLPAGTVPGQPTTLWPRRGGGLWVGTAAGDLFLLLGGRARPVEPPGRAPRDAIQALYEDPSGMVWMGLAHQGLRRLDPDTQRDLLFPAERDIVAFAGGGPGLLYLASRSQGLGLLQEGRVRWAGAPPGARVQGLRSLLLDGEGDLWVGSAEGLARFRDGAYQPLPPLPLLLHRSVDAILEDRDQHLWLATGQGVLRVPKDQLRARPGSRIPARAILFEAADGLPSREAVRGPQPTAWRTGTGNLVFATGRGLAVLDARLRLPSPPRFHLHLERVRVDDQAREPGTGLILSPGQHRLAFEYAAACPTAGDRIRFRYRLEGFEEAWNDAGDRRSAVYTNLPPGRYRFHLEAWSLRDDAPAQELGLDVQLLPAFFQRPGFWALCGLGLLALAAWLHRVRLQQLEAKTAVLAERNRLAREIHDHLAQGFTGVLLQMEAAEVQLGRLQGDPAPVLTRLEHARQLASDSLQEARRSVMALRPRKPEGTDLLGALQALATRLLTGTGIEVRCRQEGRVRPLPPALEEDLLRMAQELMTNALRHGRARSIDIALAYEGRRVRLDIRDDGRGFDPGPEAAGYGLRSIRETLRGLKGRLEVESQPGDGARVTIILPLRRWWP